MEMRNFSKGSEANIDVLKGIIINYL